MIPCELLRDIHRNKVNVFALHFKKNCGHTRNLPNPTNFFTFLIQTPKVHFFTFFHFGQKFGVVSGGPQRGSQLCKTPRNPLFGVLYVGENMYLGRMSEETRFPYMVYTRFLCSCSTSWR